LAPAIGLLCRKGLGRPAVELYVRAGQVGISADAAGRRSVVVSAGLVRACQLGRLPADQGAALIAEAVGRIRLGQTRFDAAVGFWTIPWQLLRAAALPITQSVALFPLTAFAWRIRFVVTTIAVVQSVAEDRIASGVIAAVFITLTYLTPWWQRQWDIRSQDDADRFVADHGFGDALGRFLRRYPPEPRTPESIHRLTPPTAGASLALVVGDPTPGGRG
jgi:hypothetical protein